MKDVLWRGILFAPYQSLSGLSLVAKNRILFMVFLTTVVLASGTLFGQELPTVTITGRVLDDSSGAGLVNADVFISNSTLGAATNKEGWFTIRKIPYGTHELVASRVGYMLATRPVRIIDSIQYSIDFRLKPRQLVVGGVEVVAPEPVEWKKDLARFKEFFLGDGPNADKCTILNPEVLTFSKDNSGQFEAQASQPLRIENRGLGYHLQLELVAFVVTERWLTYAWKALFRDLPSSGEDQNKEWAQRRLRTYKGSLRHFLASLAVGSAESQGFQMFRVKRFEASRIRWPMTPDDLVMPSTLPNEKVLTFDDYLEVEYVHGSRRLTQLSSMSRIEPNQNISWLELTHGQVTISTLGNYGDPFSLKVTGVWAYSRIADELPFDFVPEN